MKRSWTEEEDNYIINNVGKLTWTKMSDVLKCHTNTIQNRARELGIVVINNKKNIWTDEEVELLRKYSKQYITKNIAKKLNKSILSVQKKAIKEGIVLHGKTNPWKKWMVDYLIDNYDKKSLRQISIFIGLPYYRVKKKCMELKLDYNFNKWSNEEIQILLDNHNKCHYSELTKLLPGKSKESIKNKARSMNLDIITEIYEYNEEHAKFIKDNWNILTISDIARKLKITRGVIYNYKKKLNLANVGQKKKWTAETIEELRIMSKDNSIEKLANYFKTSKHSISTIAYRNNIELLDGKRKWSDEDIERIRNLAKDHTIEEISLLVNLNHTSLKRLMIRYNIKILSDDYGNRWTNDEVNLLIKLVNEKRDIPYIMNYIDKNDLTIIRKCNELKLDYIGFERKKWTDLEIESIKNDVKILNINQLVMKYKRSSYSIKLKLRKCNLSILGLVDYWTDEDVNLLKELIKKGNSIVEISKQLNRSTSSIENKLRSENLNYSDKKYWTKEEERYLMDNWDEHSILYLSKKLNRSKTAISSKAYLLGLGQQFLHSDALKISEISEIFNVGRNEIETTWIILGLPYKYEKVSNCYGYKYVKIDELFKFLENNQFLYDGKYFEENILGKEPTWVKEKRKHDVIYGYNYNYTSMTKKKLLQQKKYYLEMEKEKNNNQNILKKEL